MYNTLEVFWSRNVYFLTFVVNIFSKYKAKTFNRVLTLSYAIGQIIFSYYDNSRASNEDSTLISSYQHFNIIYFLLCSWIAKEKSILCTDKRCFWDKMFFKNTLKWPARLSHRKKNMIVEWEKAVVEGNFWRKQRNDWLLLLWLIVIDLFIYTMRSV